MLTEAVVSAFLQTAIAGAGLVLAIYALVAPISRKMFIQRAKSLLLMEKRFMEHRDKLTSEAKDKEINRLKKLRQQITQKRSFPRYLDIGVSLTFLSFMLLAVVTTAWLFNVGNRTAENELVIIILVEASWTGFFFLGVMTIADVSLTLRHEFESIKNKVEETKDSGIASKPEAKPKRST